MRCHRRRHACVSSGDVRLKSQIPTRIPSKFEMTSDERDLFAYVIRTCRIIDIVRKAATACTAIMFTHHRRRRPPSSSTTPGHHRRRHPGRHAHVQPAAAAFTSPPTRHRRPSGDDLPRLPTFPGPPAATTVAIAERNLDHQNANTNVTVT